MSSSPAIYRFGPYEVHPRTREIYKSGTRLKLRPQPFHILQLLAENAGQVVSREELRDLLWSHETFVDFEQGLNSAIKELRSVLNDSATNPRYIETLPKLGYRLVATVEIVNELAAAIDVEKPAPPSLGHAVRPGDAAFVERRKPVRGNWTWLYGSAVLVVLALGLVGYQQWKRSRVPPQLPVGRLMLAVLPFENMTGDPGQDYFSDGLTEEMIAQLGRIDPQHLGVIARTSVMRYKQNREQMERIGSELGVQYLLEGSVRRDAGKVRVSAQLIRIKDQTHVWSREYDRELSNLLALQSEISHEIAGEIRNTLGGTKHGEFARESALSPKSYEAYDLYLKGLFFWNKRTSEGFERAVDYYQQAVTKDPGYARAQAGLANSYALIGGYAGFQPKELAQKARLAAQKAVELDDMLAEAHVARAVVAQNFDWDWKTAETEYRRAIELDSNYATAHHWYAEYLALMGRFDEASAEIEKARQLDPLSLIIATDHGVILYYARQYDRAIEQFRAVLEMDPHYPHAGRIGEAYVEKGMYAEAIAELEKWGTVEKQSPWYWVEMTYYNGRAGRMEEARRSFESLEKLNHAKQLDPVVIAIAHIGLKQDARALDWLEKAFAEHSDSLIATKVDPIYDHLRGNPRFQELLTRIGFPR
jgi:TolB-like protein/DNA-binding winged helix-turn-helix (wHTH) protein